MAQVRNANIKEPRRQPSQLELGPRPTNVMLEQPQSASAEAIRALRTRLQSQHLALGRRALAICAPTPEIGCTFMAVNLATAMAQIGIKTLLIDADLRAPAVHKYFAPHLGGPGLVECLESHSGAVADFVQQDVHPNLDILTAGDVSTTSYEQLASDRFPDVINSCLRDYDITILDTPPANSCADALRISTMVGFSLVVARKDRTLVSDVRILSDQLRSERATVVGFVLNMF